MIASETETRVCTFCGEGRSLEEFRLRSRRPGQRPPLCRACWNACCRSYRARRKQSVGAQFCGQLAAQTDPGKVAVMAPAHGHRPEPPMLQDSHGWQHAGRNRAGAKPRDRRPKALGHDF